MIRSLERFFSYLLLLPALLPLVFFDGFLYPYLTPKTLLFRGIGVLAAASFAVLALSGRSFYVERLKNWVTWIPAALLALAYTASLFGIDFYHSFWSIFDRGDGLLTLTTAVAFFYILLLYADEAFFNRLLKWVVAVASLVAAFGVLQWIQAGSGMNIPLVPEPNGRVGSTLGNAAFMASFLGMTFFLTLLIIPSLRGKWVRAAQISAALQILAIIGSATRGTMLALLGAAGITLIYKAWKGEGAQKQYARGGLAVLVVLAGLFFGLRAELQHVPFAPVARVASISLSDVTVQSRAFIWGEMLGEIAKRPLLGVGAEHISVIFNEVYDPTKIVEEWFDRTHNAFLDYAVQYGVGGLVLYVLLIGVFLREALRLMRSAAPGDSCKGKLLVLLGFVYAVQNFFVFDTATTLWLFLALIAFVIVRREKGTAAPLTTKKVPEVFALAVGGVIALLIIPVSFMPLRANLLIADGYKYHVYDINRTVSSVEKGYALGTYADMEYGYQLYEMYTERQSTMLKGEDRIRAYRLARDILAANYEKYPYDARTVTYYAHVLDVAPPEERPSEELQRSVLVHAIELSPKRIQPRYLLSNISIRKGDMLPQGSAAKKAQYDQAILELTQYADLVPQFAEPRYIIASLYFSLNQPALAKQWADEGLAVYTKADENTARRAARYYLAVEDWQNAARFLGDVVAAEPENYEYKYDLAKAEFLAGNVERARAIVEELKKEASGLVETDPAFLSALNQ